MKAMTKHPAKRPARTAKKPKKSTKRKMMPKIESIPVLLIGKLVLAAVALAVALHFFWPVPHPDKAGAAVAEARRVVVAESHKIVPAFPQGEAQSESIIDLSAVTDIVEEFSSILQADDTPEMKDTAHQKETQKEPEKKTGAPAVIATPTPDQAGDKKARIVIIIDDMGMDHKRSEKIMALPAPLTLAFLPYAPHVDRMAKAAKDKGYEIMIHMPMEPMNPDLDTGPMTLRTGQSDEEFQEVFDEMLAALDGYVGVNNHMGSRLTQDEMAMNRLMTALKKHGLFFVDSRTISTSIAAHVAAEHGLPYASRDVFLDHDPSVEGVENALRHVERVARTHGLAIAIGHPKDATINGLAAWLPTLKDKGFVIIPVSAAVTAPEISGF